MTFEILNNVIEENNIPKDVKLMSDSGWECNATEMDGIWYNREENTLVFTQNGNGFDTTYLTDPNWVAVYGVAKDFEDENGYPIYQCLESECVSNINWLCYRKDRENCGYFEG